MANIEVKTAHLQTELPDLQPGLDSPFFETCSLHHLLTVQCSLREMVYKSVELKEGSQSFTHHFLHGVQVLTNMEVRPPLVETHGQ